MKSTARKNTSGMNIVTTNPKMVPSTINKTNKKKIKRKHTSTTHKKRTRWWIRNPYSKGIQKYIQAKKKEWMENRQNKQNSNKWTQSIQKLTWSLNKCWSCLLFTCSTYNQLYYYSLLTVILTKIDNHDSIYYQAMLSPSCSHI